MMGVSNRQERLELWQNLEDINDGPNILWLLGGDFNVALKKDEVLGGLLVG